MIIIINPCSASKDDSVPIPAGSRVVQPSYYLDDEGLISNLQNIRKNVLQNPRACVGSRETYAFDLYSLAGNVYKAIRDSGKQQRIKSMLISDSEIECFFLSGGYGIIHALEAAKKYQATFSRGIAYQKKILYTTDLWENSLTSICDAIIFKFQPEWAYVFGSQDYTGFIKRTNFWKTKNNVKIFESTGSSGPYWLAPKLNELVGAIFDDCLGKFNEKYPKFVKQLS